jgi:hypothetical protein
MLIKRVYEIDPMICPKCGQSMTVVSFIEPPQAEVIENILKHCGLWKEPASRAPPDTDSLARELGFGFLSCFTPLTRPSCSREAAVFSPPPSSPGPYLRGYRYLPGHLLTNTTILWHGDTLYFHAVFGMVQGRERAIFTRIDHIRAE